MIKSFRCDDTRMLFETGRCRRFTAISKVATRKLAQQAPQLWQGFKAMTLQIGVDIGSSGAR